MGLLSILVCGGRDYSDYSKVCEVLDSLCTVVLVEICHGAARGADSLAGRWAKERGVRCQEYPADWNTHGKAAGCIRNQQMLDDLQPCLVVAFPGGRGTEDMIRRAEKAGIHVKRVKEQDDTTS